MKQLLSTAYILICSVLTFVSCSTHSEETVNRYGIKLSEEQKARIEQVGQLHNQGLDTIFQALIKERHKLFTNQSATRNLASQEIDYSAIAINSTRRAMKGWFRDVSDEELDAAISSKNLVRTRAVEKDALSSMTAFQQKYYADLMAIIHKENTNPDSIEKEIFELEREIELNAPTVQDAELLLYATSVARYSSKYWHDNLSNWEMFLQPKVATAPKWLSPSREGVSNLRISRPADDNVILSFFYNYVCLYYPQASSLQPGQVIYVASPETFTGSGPLNRVNTYYAIYADEDGNINIVPQYCQRGEGFDFEWGCCRKFAQSNDAVIATADIISAILGILSGGTGLSVIAGSIMGSATATFPFHIE